MNKKKLLTLEHIHFAYDNKFILQDINLDIYSNELVSVIGPNGGGKTTLLKLITGLIKPTSGQIIISKEYPNFIKNNIGYVPQHLSFDFLFPVTIFDVVLMGLSGQNKIGPHRKKDKDLALQVLSVVKLDNKRSDSFSSLSGGQRQRVLIARALVSSPTLLLLDEPTASIDQESEHDLYNLIKKLSNKYSILLVSHDIGVVPQISERVICVNKNIIVHPTSELTGKDIQKIYCYTINMVRHDKHINQIPK